MLFCSYQYTVWLLVNIPRLLLPASPGSSSRTRRLSPIKSSVRLQPFS